MDKGKDARNPGWFWADNKIVDVQAAKIGIHAFAVYMVLVRYLNGDEECWPSSAAIAKTLGISKRTVVTAIQTLAAENLIGITPRGQSGKGQISNLYTVHRIGSPDEENAPPPMQEVHRGGMQDMQGAYAPGAPPPMQEVHTNKTNKNKTKRTINDGDARAHETPPSPPDWLSVRFDTYGIDDTQAGKVIAAFRKAQHELTPSDLDRVDAYMAAPGRTVGILLGFYLYKGKFPPAAHQNGHTNGYSISQANAPPRPKQPDLHEEQDDLGNVYLALPDGTRWEPDV